MTSPLFKSFWLGQYRTRNFDFRTYGASKWDAVHAMRNLLKIHAEQYHVEGAGRWVAESMAEFRRDPDGVTERCIGGGYRDGERIL